MDKNEQTLSEILKQTPPNDGVIDVWLWDMDLVDGKFLTTRINPRCAHLLNLTEADKQLVF